MKLSEAVPRELKLLVQILSTGMTFILFFFPATTSRGTQCPNLFDIRNFEQFSNCLYQINSGRRTFWTSCQTLVRETNCEHLKSRSYESHSTGRCTGPARTNSDWLLIEHIRILSVGLELACNGG